LTAYSSILYNKIEETRIKEDSYGLKHLQKNNSRAMNKQELALQYFPDATSATAVRHLTRWIARCHPLVEALTGTGYQSRNRTFTWKQVTLIRQYLGEPSATP
jgi:hypothetical protein